MHLDIALWQKFVRYQNVDSGDLYLGEFGVMVFFESSVSPKLIRCYS